MAGSVNKTSLVGCVGTKGFELRYGPSGTASASFVLACAEVWGDGKEHLSYFPCEILGKKAEAVTDLAPSTAWRKKESLLHTALLGYPDSIHSDHAA